MVVIITLKELVVCTRLVAVTIYTAAGQILEPVFATVAAVHYLHPVGLLHMQEQHHGLLLILVIACVTSSPCESYCVELQETVTQYFIACRPYSY